MKPPIKCRQCGKPVKLDESNPWRPFCSERCKLIDLGEWFSGGYSIPSEIPEEFPDAEPDRGKPPRHQ